MTKFLKSIVGKITRKSSFHLFSIYSFTSLKIYTYILFFFSPVFFRMFVTDQGSVWSCGWSADGQTGVGHYNNTDRITKCVGDIVGENIIKLACSADCVLALNGNLFF